MYLDKFIFANCAVCYYPSPCAIFKGAKQMTDKSSINKRTLILRSSGKKADNSHILLLILEAVDSILDTDCDQPVLDS